MLVGQASRFVPWRQPVHTTLIADLQKLDPPLGIPLPRTHAIEEIRRHLRHAPRGLVLVAMGDCAGCVSFDFDAWTRFLRARGIPLVGISTAPQHRIRAFVAELPAGITAVSDPGGETLGALNAVWAGRAFYFDPALRLRWRTSAQQGIQSGADLEGFRRFLDAQ